MRIDSAPARWQGAGAAPMTALGRESPPSGPQASPSGAGRMAVHASGRLHPGSPLATLLAASCVALFLLSFPQAVSCEVEEPNSGLQDSDARPTPASEGEAPGSDVLVWVRAPHPEPSDWVGPIRVVAVRPPGRPPHAVNATRGPPALRPHAHFPRALPGHDIGPRILAADLPGCDHRARPAPRSPPRAASQTLSRSSTRALKLDPRADSETPLATSLSPRGRASQPESRASERLDSVEAMPRNSPRALDGHAPRDDPLLAGGPEPRPGRLPSADSHSPDWRSP
jgi:hypothetical protein